MWGCLAKVEVPKPKQIKIGPKTVDCIFFGYALNSSACRFIVHKSEIPDINEGTYIESRNAVFFEDILPCKERKEQLSNKRTGEDAFDKDKDDRNHQEGVHPPEEERSLPKR